MVYNVLQISTGLTVGLISLNTCNHINYNEPISVFQPEMFQIVFYASNNIDVLQIG